MNYPPVFDVSQYQAGFKAQHLEPDLVKKLTESDCGNDARLAAASARDICSLTAGRDKSDA
jgi:hypothetical protein